MKPAPPPPRGAPILGTFCLCLLVVGHWAMLRTPLLGDERTHLAQVLMLEEGTGGRHPYLTTFETFHWFVARLVGVTGSQSANTVRLACTLLGMLVPVGAFLAARAYGSDPRGAAVRAASILLLPILLPYLFLIYTDGVALATILFAAWAARGRRYVLAGALGVLAVAIRQMNIVWLAWLYFLFLLQEEPWRGLRNQWPLRIAQSAPYALGAAGFLGFVWLNGGVAIGDPLSHPPGLYDENLFFFLIIAFVTLLPLVVARTPQLVAEFRRKPWLCTAVALLLALGFVMGWKADHWYNVLPHHVHNEVAMWLNDIGNRVAVAPIVVVTLFALLGMFRTRADAILWLGATLLVLAPSYMIEPRYAIVPLALFAVVRRAGEPWQEAATLGWIAILGVLTLNMTVRGAFTP